MKNNQLSRLRFLIGKHAGKRLGELAVALAVRPGATPVSSSEKGRAPYTGVKIEKRLAVQQDRMKKITAATTLRHC
jgi:hypothetical protein